MRLWRLTLGLLLFVPLAASAQDAVPPPEPAAAASLPVRRVVLYKTGVGYFEHLGKIRNRQNVTINFTSAQLDDVLKSLTALDMGKGQITGISYNSVAPIEQRLGALRLPLASGATGSDLLGALRGAHVEVTSGAGVVTGRVLSVESRLRTRDGESTRVDVLTILTQTGDMRMFDIGPNVHVRIVDRDLRQEVGRYLDVVGSTREQDVRTMTISTSGTGERSLFVSYISEVPVWKTTYRLVLPASGGRPLLQGWAIVDNTIGEDWTNVELSLVAGAPQSFIQQISLPYYSRRPVVPLPSNMVMSPQTHGATLASGVGTLRGVARDTSGAPLPGVTVTMTNSDSGDEASAVSGADGQFTVSVPAGRYRLRAELAGFESPSIGDIHVPGSTSVEQNVTMTVVGLMETVTVEAASPKAPPPPPAPSPGRLGGRVDELYSRIRDRPAVASAQEAGQLFEYRITQPVTLTKNQSALVPIVNGEVEAEPVALWTAGQASTRPLRAVWITNGTGLTLDGGSIMIVDGNAFAGEGLVEPLVPGERRLVSYAADLAITVKSNVEAVQSRVLRIRAQRGVIVRESEERATWTYTARNEGDKAVPLVIEHKLRPGWTLAPGQAPAESTVDTQRFRVLLDPKKTSSLAVREVHVGEARVAIGEVTDTYLATLVSAGLPSEALQRALRPIIDARAEVARAEEQLTERQRQQQAIVADQARLRENMKALRGSAEEKQLLQRYTRQLDEEETQLDTLKKEIAAASAARDAAREKLSTLIATVSFEIGS